MEKKLGILLVVFATLLMVCAVLTSSLTMTVIFTGVAITDLIVACILLGVDTAKKTTNKF